ncbi:hypothetical protein SeMB42_g07650 [Synchytrium endobioticum]|uniref:Uncharacterized protein n=1 Tax=Synchytrium endobioticum TaxID=286115 RepID=A0A507BZ07_9FUNG|nr:hypothetical protein SeMB42_g07650 [Synchytrium endobioticum]TPX50595.1 hypothetical protein SeLEV6574_g00787 [Synchytrium endobioticum]
MQTAVRRPTPNGTHIPSGTKLSNAPPRPGDRKLQPPSSSSSVAKSNGSTSISNSNTGALNGSASAQDAAKKRLSYRELMKIAEGKMAPPVKEASPAPPTSTPAKPGGTPGATSKTPSSISRTAPSKSKPSSFSKPEARTPPKASSASGIWKSSPTRKIVSKVGSRSKKNLCKDEEVYRLNQNKRDTRSVEQTLEDTLKKKQAKSDVAANSSSRSSSTAPPARGTSNSKNGSTNARPASGSKPLSSPVGARPKSDSASTPRVQSPSSSSSARKHQPPSTNATVSPGAAIRRTTLSKREPTARDLEDPDYIQQNYSSVIQALFRRPGNKRRYDDFDDDEDDDMEATPADLFKEEARSARIARLEDEREARFEEEMEREAQRKRAAKKKRKMDED